MVIQLAAKGKENPRARNEHFVEIKSGKDKIRLYISPDEIDQLGYMVEGIRNFIYIEDTWHETFDIEGTIQGWLSLKRLEAGQLKLEASYKSGVTIEGTITVADLKRLVDGLNKLYA